MSTGSQIAWDDTVLPFQLDASDMRGRVARLDGVLDKILSRHAYPAPIEALVAEMCLLTALIGQTVPNGWKLSLQVRGKGAARLIATDYVAPAEDGAPAQMRGYASFDAEALDPEAPGFAQIGEGYFAVLIDQGTGGQPYQGMTPIAGTALSDCASTYFAQSEQLPTRFALAFGKSGVPGQKARWRAGGILLQTMPGAGEHLLGAEAAKIEGAKVSDARAENWSRVNILLDTVEELELVGPSIQSTDLLVRLFHEEGPRVFDAQPVAFGCACSEDRVRQSLSIYSAKDIEKMTNDAGRVTADCQFCGAHYDLDPATVGFEATGAHG